VQKLWEEAANTASGMDRAAFVELMNGLWAGMGRTAKPDQTTLRVWYLCLHDLTVPQFGRGIQRYLTERSSEFVTVQMIRELSGIQQAADEASVSAWSAVVDAIKFFGGYQTPRWDRPDAARITQAISHLGGWIRLCDTESEELHKWTRQAFVKAYNAIPATSEQARLTNLVAIENARTGQTEAAEQVQRRIEQAAQLRLGDATQRGGLAADVGM
jgi:hypothetical protein